MGRMAMLGPPLHNGLYSMAWTVLAGWHCFFDIASVFMSWNRSDMHLMAWDVRRCSFELLLQECHLRLALAYSSLADET